MVAPDSRDLAGANRSIVCLVGPTACGKTSLVTRLASALPIEVISLDSRQIYRGLRIGSAQPTAEEKALCPHHLVDFLPVDQTYDAARFRRDFCAVQAEILARGNLPLLAGGAGFYLQALTRGFTPLPPDSVEDLPAVRSRINTMAPEAVRERLARVDPASYERLHPHDLYRLRRALEIFELTGRSMSALTTAWEPDPCLGLNYRIVVLEKEVAELDVRIKQRLQGMLANGWIEETRIALAEFGPAAPGLQSIGYPEISQCLQGLASWDNLEEAVFRKTRQYAKRQRTWFRGLNATLHGDPDFPSFGAEIAALIRNA